MVRSSDRALRVVARAIARSGGEIGPNGRTQGKPTENLAWATQMLDAMAHSSDYDPRVMTDLGEVLSKQPAEFARALVTLEDLARRDLITSAEGWAALAALRSPARREAALKRCVQMSLTPVKTCGMPGEADKPGALPQPAS
jgi:hypothetical protein